LLPGTSLELACEVAERLRRTVEELRVRVGGTAIGVTVSLGVASYPTRSRNPEQLFAAADRALYTAKEAGRNQVKCSMPT
jgi:diguanylate cyclase (GGDEF)-like protein